MTFVLPPIGCEILSQTSMCPFNIHYEDPHYMCDKCDYEINFLGSMYQEDGVFICTRCASDKVDVVKKNCETPILF